MIKARIANKLLLGLIFFLSATGCVYHQRSKQSVVATAISAEDATKVDMPSSNAPIISTVSNRLEPSVTFVDERSATEKQFYPGETDPHRCRDAVTILPLESFQPDFEKTVRRAILDNLHDALQYDSITIRIKSFHVALDERERGEEELLYDFKQWDDEREEQEQLDAERKARLEQSERELKATQKSLGLANPSNDHDESFGSKVVKGVFDATIVQPIKKRKAKRDRLAQLQVFPQSLPHSLTDDKKSGWNCHARIEVSFSKGEADVKTVPITATCHATKDDASPVESQMQSIVMQTVELIGNEIKSAEL